ncbi:MAG TPA: endonuclease/exonuclease/phosphatase family protein [Longimicrobiales bacterium]|nr:endonuclease/exonuclease/phosphatase family protein [Longimicrobiales bacterium]
MWADRETGGAAGPPGSHSWRNRAAVLVLVAVAAAAACATARDPYPVRVMTYNIAAGGGDLAAVAAVIRAAAPDIVALQEVDVHWSERSRFADQAAELGEALGMHVRFGPIYELPPARRFGLAILSRTPIVEFTNHVVPRLSTQTNETEPVPLPGFLEAVTVIGGMRVHVFNTHLDYRADSRVREQQVRAMLEVLAAETRPTVLMGDLNAPPSAPELQPLLAELRDAWSANEEHGLTYPAHAPDKRIDYILLSRHFSPVALHVPAAQASDHRPVIADLRLH